MDQIEEFVDERQKSWCIHCGGWIAELDTNRDHVPSKSLLREPYPANLPVVEICAACNEGFSLDEEYLVVFLNCVLAGSTDPHQQRNPQSTHSEKERQAQGENRRFQERDRTLGGEIRSVWTPELERVNRLIVKNARGHALFEYGEPMLREPQSVWSAPLETLTTEQRAVFETIETGGGWPEVGSRMLTRVVTGQDLSGSWVIVQDGIYRYAVAQRGVILVKSVLFEYLATEVFWGD